MEKYKFRVTKANSKYVKYLLTDYSNITIVFLYKTQLYHLFYRNSLIRSNRCHKMIVDIIEDIIGTAQDID